MTSPATAIARLGEMSLMLLATASAFTIQNISIVSVSGSK